MEGNSAYYRNPLVRVVTGLKIISFSRFAAPHSPEGAIALALLHKAGALYK